MKKQDSIVGQLQEGLAENKESTVFKGREFERQVAAYLLASGFQIVERNYRCFFGEIDIIALKGKDYYFIEVKGQLKDRQAELKINTKKRNRIIKASMEYIRVHHLEQGHAFHYDVAIVTNGQITYYQDAFEG